MRPAITTSNRRGGSISISAIVVSIALLLISDGFSIIDAEPVGSHFLNHFEKHEVLSELDNVQFHWTADARGNEIEMGIIAESTGWMGIGFNDKGTMKGLDIAVVQLVDGEWTVGDYFSTGFEMPARDPESRQNILLVSADRNATHTAVILSRHLTTCDDLDIDIGAAPMFVSYALGATDDFRYHAARGSKQISFFLDNVIKEAPFVPLERQFNQGNYSSAEIAATTAELHTFDWSADLALPNYTVPHADKTSTYTCFKFNLTEQLGDVPVFYTGLSATVSHKVVHHSNLYSCGAAGFAQIQNGQEDCYVMPDGCETISAWVSGKSPLLLAFRCWHLVLPNRDRVIPCWHSVLCCVLILEYTMCNCRDPQVWTILRPQMGLEM